MRTMLASVTAATALLAAAGIADARIVVGQGLAGVKLGMTEAQVTKALGKPDVRTTRKDEIMGTVVRLRYGTVKMTIGPSGSGVVLVSTTGTTERTSRGVGVGVAKSRVRQLVPGVTCQGRICSVGEALPGKVVTTFRISAAGRVSEVSVGRVID